MLDDETPGVITVTLEDDVDDGVAQVYENVVISPVVGTVTIDAPREDDLIVYLHSHDTSEATVPISVFIPAGFTTATFAVDPVDEFLDDGPRDVVITAYSDGYFSGSATLTVLSDLGGTGAGIEAYDRSGDMNRHRDQGQIVIDSNVISHVSESGILVDAGDRPVQFVQTDGTIDTTSNLPHPGTVINFANRNTERLAPGVVIQNNTIAYVENQGIEFRGDANTTPWGPVPYGRIVNNTIFGNESPVGTGILVADNASPTILNNILAYLRTGIQVQGAAGVPAPEVGHNLFQGNTNDPTTGSFAFVSNDPDPDNLFLDAARGNFYLRSGVAAIDSSLNRADDRAVLANVVKAPLGIPPSAVVSPERDVFGQLRADDEDTDPLGGGSLVFKDRGSVERVDFDAPRPPWSVRRTATAWMRRRT